MKETGSDLDINDLYILHHNCGPAYIGSAHLFVTAKMRNVRFDVYYTDRLRNTF